MKKKIVSLSTLGPELLMVMMRNNGIVDPDNVEVIGANHLPDRNIVELVKDADVIFGDFCFNKNITAEMARAAKKAKLIQQPSVGYQNIDVEACTGAGIPVANTAGANTVSVAEHVVMTGLCMVKNLLLAHRATAAGEWRQMDIGAGELQGKLWGLIGMGRIGRAVAERLIPFGVRMAYYDVAKLDEHDESRYHTAYSGLEDLLKTADIISIHCPLTDETRGMLGAGRLALMKPSAFIINVARGEVLDEQALACALKEKRLAGAALDVFSEEPVGRDNPLLKLEGTNLVLTPHIAGVTQEAKMRIITAAVRNMVAVLNGGRPDFVVNEVK
ncbi:MAG TPA: 2-hydroxyacid dehydrogenase [Spirochaetota bacterium]|nr:2-hydroxyacid dehydrogenase [Spirochaetota bacterium]HPL18406.1 2-hydroxyacid dehydrogenase [Spirochaetota bacterium]HQF07967.1 2-hydroxyacid dehydrogenase [Spirochaetota bacterium]HQH96527.1 2-hydroxyacid dehydrogenase [Spirochaetota bacterium]HQJ69699.1 2-hydroxyacid dehydrogenase [Spirochaetota bacterium]